jgi:hypothetical protein
MPLAAARVGGVVEAREVAAHRGARISAIIAALWASDAR